MPTKQTPQRRSRNRRLADPSNRFIGVPVTATITSAGASTMGIALSRPCAISGTIPVAVATLTITGQTITDPQHVVVTYSGTIATHAYSLASNTPQAQATDGGRIAALSGTF